MMEICNPFFSIIIPAFNVENYIERAVLSVIEQDFQNFEVIIINDASNDKTKLIIEKYARSSNKISIINKSTNESLHIARLDGVAKSIGEYILFLDGDDYFAKNAFSVLYKTIQANSRYDFYEFGYTRQPSGKEVHPSLILDNRFLSFFKKKGWPDNTMWNKAYNTTIIKKAFTLLERVYLNHIEDYYESVVIAYYVQKTFRINDVIINYSIGTGISTTYKDYNQTINLLKSLKIMFALIETFLRKVNINISLTDMYYRYLSQVIHQNINPQKEFKDKKRLFFQLPNYFDINVIMEYFFDRMKVLQNLESITDSRDYKVGKIIVAPLRKVKHIIRRIL